MLYETIHSKARKAYIEAGPSASGAFFMSWQTWGHALAEVDALGRPFINDYKYGSMFGLNVMIDDSIPLDVVHFRGVNGA